MNRTFSSRPFRLPAPSGISAIAVSAVAAALVLLPAVGCKKTVDDATLTTNVKSALAADNVIAQTPINVATQAGVVTLTGNVPDETASSLAASDTAKVSGVKEVVDNLTVAGLAVTPTITTSAAPTAPRPATRAERSIIRNHGTLPPPDNGFAPAQQQASAPAPPPPPAVRTVTVDAGSSVSIRITENLDSETTQPGTPFSGVVTRPVVRDGFVAIPAGAAVRGTVVDAKDAGHFKGSSLLELRLDSIRRMPVSTESYVVEGKGRGTNSAEKIGGGAAVGAILGGILGGGKGAAIGAGAGGGGGAILQGVTRGQQVHIASESVIPFRLASPITVQTSEEADTNYNDQNPGLQQH